MCKQCITAPEFMPGSLENLKRALLVVTPNVTELVFEFVNCD